MKLLIIGGAGMAGHLIADYLEQMTEHEVWRTVRGKPAGSMMYGGASGAPIGHFADATAASETVSADAATGTDTNKVIGLDVTDEAILLACLQQLKPDVVVNAAGVLNHHAENDRLAAIRVNSLLPQLLASHGRQLGFRLIHISTDCVFSGDRGSYTESDPTDALTVYARTKQLGEVTDAPHLTIRTSIIGPELKMDGIGLFHWFMQQTGTIQGYTNVWWNGVTTLELAKIVTHMLTSPLTGLVQLTGPRHLSKYELLQLFKQTFQREDILIKPSGQLHSDKTLVNTRDDFTVQVPDYPQMLEQQREWMERQGPKRYSQYPG